ncbi:T6SS immunity protein Tdi1 domain-containing protein [Kingella oralis]|uniref:T6SS immunity protein Tdi1 domain-containing protein n=1 Tax=Kingella oralis TaxID=505 RepID=UPI0034E5550F
MFVWEPTYGNKYCIIPHFGFITVGRSHEKMIKKGDADFALKLFFLVKNPEYLDMEDDKGKPLFQRTVKKFGALAEDEMFSFVPALAAGGDALIGNVDKVNLFIQFDLLRQLVEPRVFDDKDMIAHGWGGKPL